MNIKLINGQEIGGFQGFCEGGKHKTKLRKTKGWFCLMIFMKGSSRKIYKIKQRRTERKVRTVHFVDFFPFLYSSSKIHPSFLPAFLHPSLCSVSASLAGLTAAFLLIRCRIAGPQCQIVPKQLHDQRRILVGVLVESVQFGNCIIEGLRRKIRLFFIRFQGFIKNNVPKLKIFENFRQPK